MNAMRFTATLHSVKSHYDYYTLLAAAPAALSPRSPGPRCHGSSNREVASGDDNIGEPWLWQYQ